MDGGKSWLIKRQFYLSRMDTAELLDDSLQGMMLRMVEGKEPV
jgi:hypothetical protein